MTAIIKTEFQKMKRYHILLIALIGMFCSPLLQLFSQFAMNDALKDPYYDLAALLESTIWGNAQIFLPVMITLTGGYLINREYTDNGVGMESEDLKHIFERLYKCDRARSEKGSGLGLSIARQLTEKMGGRITVQSQPGKGTRFTLTFPLCE